MGIFLQKGLGRQDHGRSTETALNGPLMHEGFLDGVEFILFGQSFDGGYRLSGNLHGSVRGQVLQ